VRHHINMLGRYSFRLPDLPGVLRPEPTLARGDKVAVSARDVASLDALKVYGDAVLAFKLDVTDKSAVFPAVRQAKDHFGRLDVIVNNAGYGPFGAVEELSEEDLRPTRSMTGCARVS
jgi:NAD(P)-dependent dehydrogenase (short-subunit alcohol dehydrogenase family)